MLISIVKGLCDPFLQPWLAMHWKTEDYRSPRPKADKRMGSC